MGSLRIPLLDKITGKLPSSVLPDLSGNYATVANAALTGSPTLNGKPLVDKPTAQGIALVNALIFGS